jgi:hypothetical protein
MTQTYTEKQYYIETHAYIETQTKMRQIMTHAYN